mmetsp:Transcript_39270/g.76821  ORF Transcript_39270/g.76821 Transcript_39270/m.76821 type:complete len:175 (-) Transcript_39270:601-1125(-)|eukprot:CAMPEP_0173377336 /NCGR_PEP_ID=MMETSP1356-20130122/525_1 /TAXON_ID=77927 ORGANISM="Hemiselmis virescens, Strain PCC157" /NCGR_SAMPLE_ID=MMETSP1356 /ASSEMBLY_ACC=CAM_ASM_000847 /LENGTH=174 /DNA_ID=CAMNT_0014330009 /DNA_START=229 /DNA_END=753 /DNA_ORIENTATION=+
MGVEQSCCVKRGDDKDVAGIQKTISRSAKEMPGGFTSGGEVSGGERLGGSMMNHKSNNQRNGTTAGGNSNGSGGGSAPPMQEKVGVGVYFASSANEPGTLIVKSIIKGSPAFKSNKISVGDTVLMVDGTSVVGKQLAGLAELLLGKPGTQVKLTFKSASSGDKYDVELTRGLNV